MLLEVLTNKFDTFYLVGGGIRNILFNNTKSDDLDVITLTSKEEVKYILGKDFYYIEINDVIRVKDIERNSHIDIYSTDDLMEDLKRRDFDLNSIALNLKTNEYINMCDNLTEIRYNDNNYAKEVSLSPIRALRQALQCNLFLNKYILDDIYDFDINSVDIDNLRKELFQILLEDNGLYVLKSYGLLEKLIPKFKDTYEFNQNSKYHDLDLFDHINATFKAIPNKLELRLTMLLHDICKIDCVQIREDGHYSFLGHDKASSQYAMEFLKSINTPHAIINRVVLLIENHMNKNMKVSTMVNKLGLDGAKDLIEVLIADCKGRININQDELDKFYKMKDDIYSQVEVKSKPLDKTKPNLYIIVGLPRSSKSTFFKNNYSHCEYLSRDEIRENVFGYKGNMNHEEEVTRIFNDRLNSALNKGLNVFVDNTNVQTKYRNKILNQAKSRKYNLIAFNMKAKYEDVIANANKEGFPISVIESMACRLNEPKYEESYNEIYEVIPTFTDDKIIHEVRLV